MISVRQQSAEATHHHKGPPTQRATIAKVSVRVRDRVRVRVRFRIYNGGPL